MKKKAVGVSILTNADRREALERCLKSLLENCYYRPLIIGIFDNGSTDDTGQWLSSKSMPDAYGVDYRFKRSEDDLGVGRGTNNAIYLVNDCKYALHLESDWEHLTEEESGVGKMWLAEAVEWMERSDCDYLYLRRFVNGDEAVTHWWSQWFNVVSTSTGPYDRLRDFWWSNNPHLRNNVVLQHSGVLPLPAVDNDRKGEAAWCMSEFRAKHPSNPWFYRYGMFVHERQKFGDLSGLTGCSTVQTYGYSGCKYGWFVDGEANKWCKTCDHNKSSDDLLEHELRVNGEIPTCPVEPPNVEEKPVMPQIGTQNGLKIKVVIQNYNKPSATDGLASALSEEFDVEVLDSGSDWDKIPKSTTIACPNIYSHGGVRKCCDMLLQGGYDVLWRVECDVRIDSSPKEYRESIERCYPFGIWTPSISGVCFPSHNAENYKDGQARVVKYIDAQAMAFSRQLVERAEKVPECFGKSLAWGIAFWASHMANLLGHLIVVDGAVRAYHPSECSYDQNKAAAGMANVFNQMFGPSWREDVVEFSQHFDDLVIGTLDSVRAKLRGQWQLSGEPPTATVLIVDNGWGIPEFERIMLDFPRLRKIILKTGDGFDFVCTGNAVINQFSEERLEYWLDKVDFAMFTRVLPHNKSALMKVLSGSGLPVVLNSRFFGEVGKHDRLICYHNDREAIGKVELAMGNVEPLVVVEPRGEGDKQLVLFVCGEDTYSDDVEFLKEGCNVDVSVVWCSDTPMVLSRFWHMDVSFVEPDGDFASVVRSGRTIAVVSSHSELELGVAEKLLRLGVPVVLKKQYGCRLVSHDVDGFLYGHISWAIGWTKQLLSNKMLYDRVSVAAMQKHTGVGHVGTSD